MNAALMAACANNSRRIAQYDYVYIPQKVERPIVGMIKVENNRDAVIVNDLVNDGVELRFRSVLEVTDLIRKLEALRENMMALIGE